MRLELCRTVLAASLVFVLSALVLNDAVAAAPAREPAAKTAYGGKECAGCHGGIGKMHDPGKHKSVGCGACHDGIAEHLKSPQMRPVTRTGSEACGACHKNQYETMYKVNYNKTARNEKSQAGGPSPNPAWDKLMTPHGFTKEHNVPRSTPSRSTTSWWSTARSAAASRTSRAGGPSRSRRQFHALGRDLRQVSRRSRTSLQAGHGGRGEPGVHVVQDPGPHPRLGLPGRPRADAKWSRTSKVNEFVKDVNHSLNCIFCHDPHCAQPRIIRDGLIQALTRPEKDTLWHADDERREDRREGTRRARPHAQDRHPRQVRHQAAMRPVPRRVQLQPGHRSDDRQADRHGRPAHQPLPVQGRNEIGKHYTTSSSATSSTASPARCCGRRSTRTSETYYGSVHDKAGIDATPATCRR